MADWGRMTEGQKVVKAERRRWRTANDPEYKARLLANAKRWKDKNRARLNELNKTRYKEVRRAYSKSDKRKARSRVKYQEYRTACFDHYGWECSCCGEDLPDFLNIDHTNNDGAQHRKTANNHIYQWIVNNGFPDSFRTLCYNCNLSRAKQPDKVCPCYKRRASQRVATSFESSFVM